MNWYVFALIFVLSFVVAAFAKELLSVMRDIVESHKKQEKAYRDLISKIDALQNGQDELEAVVTQTRDYATIIAKNRGQISL